MRRLGRRAKARSLASGAVALVVMSTLAWSATSSAGLSKSSATITGAFGDSCRHFESRSSKEIGHVEIHYADTRVVKDEIVASHDFSIDGGAGDEIASAIVKSGRTTQQFNCDGDSPPAAVLEIKTPASCGTSFDGSLICNWSSPTVWTAAPSVSFHCTGAEAFSCGPDVILRGTSSGDLDNDIVSWSLAFGDGTSASGSWASPPAELPRGYASGFYTALLTVTDSGGRTSTDSATLSVDRDGLD